MCGCINRSVIKVSTSSKPNTPRSYRRKNLAPPLSESGGLSQLLAGGKSNVQFFFGAQSVAVARRQKIKQMCNISEVGFLAFDFHDPFGTS
jgi:hypothetical protein